MAWKKVGIHMRSRANFISQDHSNGFEEGVDLLASRGRRCRETAMVCSTSVVVTTGPSSKIDELKERRGTCKVIYALHATMFLNLQDCNEEKKKWSLRCAA